MLKPLAERLTVESGTMLRHSEQIVHSLQTLLPGHVIKAEVTFALRRGYGGRRETEVATGWPYAVWLYFTGRRVAVEL